MLFNPSCNLFKFIDSSIFISCNNACYCCSNLLSYRTINIFSTCKNCNGLFISFNTRFKSFNFTSICFCCCYCFISCTLSCFCCCLCCYCFTICNSSCCYCIVSCTLSCFCCFLCCICCILSCYGFTICYTSCCYCFISCTLSCYGFTISHSSCCYCLISCTLSCFCCFCCCICFIFDTINISLKFSLSCIYFLINRTIFINSTIKFSDSCSVLLNLICNGCDITTTDLSKLFNLCL